MNHVVRKKEQERIILENQHLYRKIGECKASLLKSKFDHDYKARKDILKKISKQKYIE